MYKVRLIENIFENHVAEFTLTEKMTVGQIRELLKLDNQAKFFQNGKELKDSQTPKEGSFTIKLVPGTFTTAVAIISVVIAISAVVIGLVALSNLNNTKFPNLSNSNASLRGSTNNARKSERLPLLLGKHRVYPDVAALPFSSYQGHNQYLHQLFCFGYNDVVIDYSTLKIGETLISYYEDCTYNVDLGDIYPSRVVENVYQLQLKNDGSSSPIVRSTASACKKIEVGLMAPNGIYKYEGEDKKSLSIGIKIDWRVPDGSWNTAYEETLSLNTDKWRKMYSITPTGSTDDIYEVRVQRTTQEAQELQVSDSLYLDVIKSFVGLDEEASLPVTTDNLQLVSLKTKATDQLNGIIDSFNAICTLKTRAWDGLGTGSSHWTAQATRNPASAILYLLTNSNANAEPVEDSLIDWASFEEFYQFCEDYGFNCDAWVTTEYTVLQLCEFIAASNMAEMVIQCDKISIRAEKAQESVVQLFTPRNAWDFEMIRSFESKPKNITVNFDDETKGYVQVERKVALNDSGSIVFDTEVEGDSLTIDSFGVTSATQAARLGAQKLKLLYSQTRTYSWKSDIEGIFCLPGDVVLLENDNFLLGLGEGRIKKILYSNSKITGIKLDARMKMVSGSSYGVRIRTSSAILDSLPVVTVAGEDWTLTFQSPQETSIDINVGDLVAFGEFKTESHKVLITDITPDQNRSCSFKGVDYSEAAYSQELTIPSYDSGLSVYPSDGGEVGASGQISVPRYYVYGTKGEKGEKGDTGSQGEKGDKGDKGDTGATGAQGPKGEKGEDGLTVKIQYCYSSSLVNPNLENQLSWGENSIAWSNEDLYWIAWKEDTLAEKEGYYIWCRIGLGENPEKWTYARLTGAKGDEGESGVAAQVCAITCNKSVVTRNDRLTTQDLYVFTTEVQGYSSTPTVKITCGSDITTLALSQSNTKWLGPFAQNHYMAKAITATVYLDDVEMDSITLGVVDETEHGVYLGVFASHPTTETGTRFVKGDSYFNSTDNLLYTYGTHGGATGWYLLSAYEKSELSYEERGSILAKGMSDALSTIKEGTVTKSDYAYLNSLIVGIVTATYIGSRVIQLKKDTDGKGGVIASSGISTETSKDVDVTTGLLTKEGFRFEDDGSLRANKLFLGLSSGDNKIIIDNTSIRCINGNSNVLWELLPNGSIVADNLKAKGDITASSLSCNALTTQEPVGNKVFKSSETLFTKELFSSSEALQWIIDKYTGNTIPTNESAFISSGWTYNGKSINHIAFGVYAISSNVTGDKADHTPLILGTEYYNSKTINAGNNKQIFNRMLNNYSFPIWVYADISLGGIMNKIATSVYHSKDGSWLYDYADGANAWICLMPNQEIIVKASSWAWWGSQTARTWLRVYPSYNNLCFASHPVEVTSLRGITYEVTETAHKYNLCSIALPTGHPNTLVVVLNGKTKGTANLADTKYVSFRATGGAVTKYCSASFAVDDNYTWVWHISDIPSDATALDLCVELQQTEAVTDSEGVTTNQTVDYDLIISRLVYAVCYNYEAHNALIRYDNGSLQYIGSKRSYVQGTFSEVGVVRYASSSIYNQIKTALGVENGEYNITTEDTTITVDDETKTIPATSITIDGTTYTGMSKMIVADTYISFWGDTSSVIIYSGGYNSTGAGSANDGGWYGDAYLRAEATISVLTQPLGASTALLFPKANNTYDLGKKDSIYRTLYVNEIKSVKTYGAVFN